MKRHFIYLLTTTILLTNLFTSCEKEKDLSVAGVTLNKTVLTLTVGDKETLIANIKPDNAYTKEVTWQSSNTYVATVDENGTVTATAGGTAIITVTTRGNQRTATCTLTIKEEPFTEPEMVFVQEGNFWMGGTFWDWQGDETPRHIVRLSSFNIGKYEVTQKQWRIIMGNNPSTVKGDNYPVTDVSWYDVQEFIQRLNDSTGKNYRLPTEAEWEYAAHGGNKGKDYEYSGSANIDDVAWFKLNSGNAMYNLHPIGTKMPNELGIYDMSGNVWEWTNDRYGKYPEESQTDPQGPSSGYAFFVVRGGSYAEDASYCRVTRRLGTSRDSKVCYIGFRLAHP